MKTFLMAIATLVVTAATFTSSAVAEDRFARVYSNPNYGGRSLKIQPWDVWVADDWWNDKITSLKVPEGCVLSVREHRHRKNGVRVLGEVYRFKENNRNLHRVFDKDGESWNNRISLMVLRC